MKIFYLIILSGLLITQGARSQPVIAFTFDDPETRDVPVLTWQEKNDSILNTLKRNNIRSTLFVCGHRVNDDSGKELINSWDINGHQIANHSFDHKYYHSSKFSYDDFKADFLKNDSLISSYNNFTRLFRFPYLKEGNTILKRDSARALLKEMNYKEGYVGIDASDWYVNQLLTDTLNLNKGTDISIYKKIYLDHITERAEFYDSLATLLTGRKVKLVLLLHHNLTSALFLEDLIQTFKNNDWRIISSDEAWTDPVYSEYPDILPAGESIIWALAKETGKYDGILRYPGEDSEYEEVRFREVINASHK
ncbi:MAG TPA: polysaccharide deacetylase family protein [Ignavibacteria bacterium]|nr:polysaccharide deacetylase family protein [Ignavibacteria bacterium]HMR41603.1 polysaccharide deacetylase family protein [Ignavibacteria bacterium]